jgi:DNA modification methylase
MTPYYSDEWVTIYHGDSRAILPSLPMATVVLADPPYALGGNRKEWRVTASVAIALSMAAQRVTKGGCMAAMTAASGRGMDFVRGAIEPTLQFNRLLVWHKEFVNSPVAGPWRWDIVPILMFGKASFGRPKASSCYRSNGHSNLSTDHPAELPVGIGRWLLEGLPDGLMIDPFAGSGSFLVAAREMGRPSIGIEADEKWCELAAARMGQEVMAL